MGSGIKNTMHNIGDKLWLVTAHSENPHGFPQVWVLFAKLVA
jgi:hypothetical protein